MARKSRNSSTSPGEHGRHAPSSMNHVSSFLSFSDTLPISAKADIEQPRSPGSTMTQSTEPTSAAAPQQQARRVAGNASADLTVILEFDMLEIFGTTQPPSIMAAPFRSSSSHNTSNHTTVLLPSAFPVHSSASVSNSSAEATLGSSSTYLPPSSGSSAQRPQRTKSILRQLPVLRSCTFVLLRILLFPKTIFVKSAALGRGCLQKVGITNMHRTHHHHHHHHRPVHNGRHHLGTHQRPSAFSNEPSYSRSGSASHLDRDRHNRRNRRSSDSRSRSRSPSRRQYQSRTQNSGASTSLSFKNRSRACCSTFLNSYNVQVATVCVCLTGESFAQSVMCPFLYYMVRDFHVGPDIWIGYYAGLLWTGFWSANLATTLFWGHLSDKYGRKMVLLIGLFMTSVSTLFLGLSSCYHDAMLALVLQGACTGLVPVSKCSIGEMATRQQRLYDAERAMGQRHNELHHRPPQPQEQSRREKQSLEQPHPLYSDVDLESVSAVEEKAKIATETEEDVHPEDDVEGWSSCSDPDCCDDGESESISIEREKATGARVDFASKGYSAVVIALAVGAALGPLAGGSLTKKQIHGFEKYPYFAPCLLAALVGFFLTAVVAVVLNETHPKWEKISEWEQMLENISRTDDTNHRRAPLTCERPGYEVNRRHNVDSNSVMEQVQTSTPALEMADAIASQETDIHEPPKLLHAVAQDRCAETGAGPRSRLRPQTFCSSTLVTTCTCPSGGPAVTTPRSSRARALLSPASELYLVLVVYTLLVLTSILGSEFIMLYTQSPVLRGGLEFSAKVLGQVLTLRGILKLMFNLFGYPWMVSRLGLLRCLKLGIMTIGTVSALGLGLFVPWSVADQRSEVVAGRSFEEVRTQAQAGSSGPRPMDDAKDPIGMHVILLCLSLISIGDVLGYISVLVLFGKSADRLKGAKDATGPEGSTGETHSSRGGSGILWSLAQVSANVMRLTGPVLAGLLWSVTDKSSSTDLRHAPLSTLSSSFSSKRTHVGHIAEPQSSFSLPMGSMRSDLGTGAGGLQHGVTRTFWTTAGHIAKGSTSVFYIVGTLCVLNLIACHFLAESTSAPALAHIASSETVTLSENCSAQEPREQEHHHAQCPVHDPPQPQHANV